MSNRVLDLLLHYNGLHSHYAAQKVEKCHAKFLIRHFGYTTKIIFNGNQSLCLCWRRHKTMLNQSINRHQLARPTRPRWGISPLAFQLALLKLLQWLIAGNTGYRLPHIYVGWIGYWGKFTVILFYPRDAMLARVIEIATCLSVCLSVCPCVRHVPVLCQNEES